MTKIFKKNKIKKIIKEEYNLTKYNFVNTTKSNKSINISHR